MNDLQKQILDAQSDRLAALRCEILCREILEAIQLKQGDGVIVKLIEEWRNNE